MQGRRARTQEGCTAGKIIGNWPEDQFQSSGRVEVAPRKRLKG
jgi:hypothetical protein